MRTAAARELAVGEHIERLIPYVPGKPVEEVKRELGLEDVIKLASNENALGPSPLAMQAMHEAVARVHHYPDGACHRLREAVAAYLGVPGDHLIFGNGSDDVIRLLGLTFLMPGDEIIQADPTFSQYEAAAILCQARTHRVFSSDWRHDIDAMADRINANTRFLFITNPNNPTGTMVTAGEVERLMQRVPDRVLVVFDEAYFEYVDRPDYPDTLRYVREGRNVVVLRTFSKIYGLAGLRLGYGVARPEVIRYLNRVREPFNVNLIAQAAGAAALADVEHLERTRRMTQEGRRQFYAAFDRLGLPYAPSEANFVWVDVRRDCRTVFEALLRRGVIVRTGDIFGAPTHLRVTIGTADENARFIRALEEVLQQ